MVKEERRKQKLKKDSLKVDVEVMANGNFSSMHFFIFKVKRTSVGGIKEKILRRKSRGSVSVPQL